jgi:hypothetical protein
MALLFVNQTEKSVVRCNNAAYATGRRQVNQYVQKRHHGAKRQRRKITIKNIPSGWLRDKSYDECLPTATDSEPSAEDNRIILQPLSRLPPYTSNQATKRRPSFDLTKSLCTVQIDDPEFFGIQAGGGEHASRLLDYYMQVFGPAYVWPPYMVPFGSTATFQQHFFQYSMKHKVVLQSVLMLCQAQLELKSLPESQPSRMTLIYRGKALNKLRHKLARSDIDDSVLVAVVGALTYDLTYSNWPAFEANLRGLRHLIQLRGGLQNLDPVWQGWFGYISSWAELRWANHIAKLVPQQPGHTPIRLTYPSHPYPPKICELISKLPAGFRDVAIATPLSVQILHFILRTYEWYQNYSRTVPGQRTAGQTKFSLEGLSLGNRAALILDCCELNPKERLLCISMLSYIVSFDGQHARHPTELEDHMLGLKEICQGITPSMCTSTIWTALVFAASKDSISKPLRNRWLLLDRVVDEGKLTHWAEVEPILRRYFWNDNLLRRWKVCWYTARERKRHRKG